MNARKGAEMNDATSRAYAGEPIWPMADAGPNVIRAGYAGFTALRRHRRLCFIALTLCSLLYGFAYGLFGQYLMLQLTVPLLILTMVVIWLLPDTGRAPTQGMARLIFAFVVALLCWPDYLALALPGLPWITAIRLVCVPLLFLMMISLSTSSGFRADMKAVLSASPMIWKLLATFMVVAGLSIVLSSDIPLSISKFVVAQLAWTTIFFASCYVFLKPGRVMLFAKFLWGIAFYDGLIGLYEAWYSRVPWAGRIPSFLAVEDESVQRILQGAMRAATGIYRVQAKFTTSLGLAEFLALTIPFLLHIIMTTKSILVRMSGIATIPFLFYIIVKTDSRLGMIGFFMSFLVYLLFWGAIRWRRQSESLFGPAIVIAYPAIFAAFIAATFAIGRLHTMVWGSGAQQFSTDARKMQYAMGIPMVLRNPIGHGIGEGAKTLGFVNLGGDLTIDTYYLAVALEYGVVGFVAFYGMLLLTIYKAGRAALDTRDPEILWLAPIAIALVNFVIIKSVFSQQENHPLVFMMIGMAMALLYRAKRETLGRAAGTGLRTIG